MDGFSPIHLLFFLFFAAAFVIPYWKIFPRAAWSSWLSLLMVVPVVNLVMLWVLAFKKWPDDKDY